MSDRSILFIIFYSMKTFLRTTLFWIIVVFGFAFYIKSFNADMANGMATRLGATSVANQDMLSTGQTTDVMSGINAIQTTLIDMQETLKGLAGDTTPMVTPTVETLPATGTTAE